MILLGAGASKVFGIKTMQDMTDDLIEKIRSMGHDATIGRIHESLEKFGLTPDFEAIYTIVEGLTNPEDAIKKSGPFAAYVCRDLKDIVAHRDFSELLFDFKDFIYKECTIKSQVLRNKRSVYDKLFQILDSIGNADERNLTTSMRARVPVDSSMVRLSKTIVTTNYDMSIELYHRMIGEHLRDGFGTTTDPYIEEMDVRTYADFDSRWLIKLHGSIWQFKQGNRVIKTIGDPKDSPLEIKIDEEMMIYPIGEKPLLRDPYHVFYEIFKQQRWNRMVAIGYSFRDEPVNIAILENLERMENATLIVVNPNAKEVVENLRSWPQKFNNRIIRIPNGFEDKGMFEKLELALKVNSWKRYQDREWKIFQEKTT